MPIMPNMCEVSAAASPPKSPGFVLSSPVAEDLSQWHPLPFTAPGADHQLGPWAAGDGGHGFMAFHGIPWKFPDFHHARYGKIMEDMGKSTGNLLETLNLESKRNGLNCCFLIN